MKNLINKNIKILSAFAIISSLLPSTAWSMDEIIDRVDKHIGIKDKDREMLASQPSIVRESSFQKRVEERSILEDALYSAQERPVHTAVTIGGFFAAGYKLYKWLTDDKNN